MDRPGSSVSSDAHLRASGLSLFALSCWPCFTHCAKNLTHHLSPYLVCWPSMISYCSRPVAVRFSA